MFLIEIRYIFTETMNNLNFFKNSLVINPLTTVRFSKLSTLFQEKFKFQTPISPDLKWFSPFVCKIYLIYIWFKSACVTRNHSRGLRPLLQPLFGTPVSCACQSVSVEQIKFSYIRRTTRGGEGGEVSPALFWKLEKSALIWGKMPWLGSYMAKLSHLKCNF